MPLMLFRFYRVIRSWRKGRDFFVFRFYRVIRSWRKGRDFFARLEYKQDGIPSCRGCGHSGVVFYDHYYRKAKVASIDGRIYNVIIKARRYRCPKCGRIYREPIRGLKENKRISENAKDEIIDKYLERRTRRYRKDWGYRKAQWSE